MTAQKSRQPKITLLQNSRFWLLSAGIVLALFIGGVIQLITPSSSLQIARASQVYGNIAVVVLSLVLLITPFTKAYPKFSYNKQLLHARRALGVLVFFYAGLHGWLTFFMQLGGFEGVKYYNSLYQQSIGVGFLAFIILFLMAITSFDDAVSKMGFKKWKILHRFVYVAVVSIGLHVLLIGSHYKTINFVSISSVAALSVYVWLQITGRQRK